MNDILLWLTENVGTIVSGVLAIIGGASVLAKITPTPKDDEFLKSLRELLEQIALNPRGK